MKNIAFIRLAVGGGTTARSCCNCRVFDRLLLAQRATSARRQTDQIEDGRKARRAAEHYIGLTHPRVDISPIGIGRADYQIVDGIAIDIAGTTDRKARPSSQAELGS